ncbi:hypothetical protein ABWJ92_20810 [Streptomyces sp. NPDC000609]|uniref:WXG100 family type VII secretion target n=1 Tax=Streptomyces sp. NPDC000609 TaxID=3160957 RepID=UPI00339AAB4D
MPNVQLVKDAANTAIEEMVAANTSMVQALNDMKDQITPLAASFTGATAAAWLDFQNYVDTATADMNHAFGQGSQALQQMIDAQIEADLKGSGQF